MLSFPALKCLQSLRLVARFPVLLEVIEPLQHDGDVDIEQVCVVFAVPDGIDFQPRRRGCETLTEFFMGSSHQAFVDDDAGFYVLEKEPDLSAVGVEGDFHGYAVLDFGHGFSSWSIWGLG